MLPQYGALKSKYKSLNNPFAICCCCIAVILIIIGIITFLKALARHSHANSYSINGQCTIYSESSKEVAVCDVGLSCDIQILWTYYYITDHKECNDKKIEITSSEQIESGRDRSFSVGETRDCYTNSNCDDVYFIEKFNSHHANAGTSYFGVIVLLIISCCCVLCAFHVIKITRKQKEVARLSYFNSIKVDDKYTFCVDNMLRKCYYDDGYCDNMEYIHILSKDVKQLICRFIVKQKNKNQFGLYDKEGISLLNTSINNEIQS